MKRKTENGWMTFVVIAIPAAIVLWVALYLGTETNETIAVHRTARVSYGSGDYLRHKYLVYTDRGTFECSDSLLFMRFDSSDVYGSLESGHSYRVRVVGWRVPLFSMYQNIIEVHG